MMSWNNHHVYGVVSIRLLDGVTLATPKRTLQWIYAYLVYIYILQTPGTSLPTTRCLTWDSYGVAGVQKIFALMKEI